MTQCQINTLSNVTINLPLPFYCLSSRSLCGSGLGSECDVWVQWERVWVTVLLWPTPIRLGSSATLSRAQMIPPLAFLLLRSFVLCAFHADCFKAGCEM